MVKKREKHELCFSLLCWRKEMKIEKKIEFQRKLIANLKNQNEEIKRENDNLKKAIAQLKNEKDMIQQAYENAWDKLQDCLEEVEDIRVQYDIAQKTLKHLQKQYENQIKGLIKSLEKVQ